MRNWSIFIFFVLSLVVFSCKKNNKDSILGLDVQPEGDLLGYSVSDTNTLFMHTFSIDSVRSVRSFSDRYKLLGSNQDPIFGRCDASIYTNFVLPNNVTNVSFGSNPNVDYAEIRLVYQGDYSGDTITALQYDVFQLEDILHADSLYYTKSDIKKSSQPISSSQAKIKIVNSKLCLVLPVDKNFAQYIIQSPNYLTDNTTFINAFKGFYITASNSSLNPISLQGCIRRFDMEDAGSGFFVYYHNGNSSSNKPLEYQFTFNGSSSIKFTRVSADHNSGAAQDFVSQITNDTITDGNDVYLQGFGLTKVKLYMPFIKNYSDSQHVSINRAELTLKIDQLVNGDGIKYSAPPNISLLVINEDWHEAYVKDQYYSSVVQFGGDFDSENNEYKFNIARQLQDIVDGTVNNYGFYIVQANPVKYYVTKRDDRHQRLVIGGPKNPLYKPTLRMTYIKFPHDK